VYRVLSRPREPRPHGWLPGLERVLPDETAVRRGEPVPRLALERRIMPDFGVTWFHRALEIWATRRDARAAEAACREALRRGFVLPAVWDTLGGFLFVQGRFADAAAAMRQALALDPGNAVAMENLAETLRHLPARH